VTELNREDLGPQRDKRVRREENDAWVAEVERRKKEAWARYKEKQAAGHYDVARTLAKVATELEALLEWNDKRK
jgi:hypothetical protein